VTLAETFSAELHVLTIFPDLPIGMYRLHLPEDTELRLAHQARDALDAFVAEHIPSHLKVTKHVDTGRVAPTILKVAGEVGADLIAMASHHPEASDYLVSPNAPRVVRHSEIAVLVIR